ncbi:hypothetical protein [Candidatus Poriferisodalis sp.]|uniref:hypothetical protein n=1 Tax=Candidatus Poriferisodalis sp. TaxID=3101277 RepID=UPI003D12DBE9
MTRIVDMFSLLADISENGATPPHDPDQLADERDALADTKSAQALECQRSGDIALARINDDLAVASHRIADEWLKTGNRARRSAQLRHTSA